VSCDGCGKSYPSYYNYTRLELKRFSAFLRVYHIVGRSYNAQSNAFSRKSEKESVIRGENVRFKISIHFSPAVIEKKFTTLEERQCLFPLFFSTRHFQLEGCGLRADGMYSCQYCSVRLPTLSGIKNHARMMVGGPYCSVSNIYWYQVPCTCFGAGIPDPRHFKRIRIQFLTVMQIRI
jgi:hypothetical protein